MVPLGRDDPETRRSDAHALISDPEQELEELERAGDLPEEDSGFVLSSRRVAIYVGVVGAFVVGLYIALPAAPTIASSPREGSRTIPIAVRVPAAISAGPAARRRSQTARRR